MTERFKIDGDNLNRFENIDKEEFVDLYFGEKTLKTLEDGIEDQDYFHVNINQDAKLYKIFVRITGLARDVEKGFFAIQGETSDGKKFEGSDKLLGKDDEPQIGYLRVKIEKGYSVQEDQIDDEYDL